MNQVFANNARAVLVQDNGTTLVVDEAVNIPALAEGDYFTATLYTPDSRYGSNIEIVHVTAVDGGTGEWTVVRGQEGTDAVTHGDGTRIELRLTAEGLVHTHDWSQVTGQPATATRWPSWSEVTSKPATATRWPTWDEVTNKPSTASPIPVGTKMLFQQTNAPTGWTKDTTHNNKALRVVTGTAGSGGSNAFTTAFNSNRGTSSNGAHSHTITVNNHTLNTSRIPSHAHSIATFRDGAGPNGSLSSISFWSPASISTNATGGSGAHNHSASSNSTGAHTHSLNLNVQYVDLIIATKQ